MDCQTTAIDWLPFWVWEPAPKIQRDDEDGKCPEYPSGTDPVDARELWWAFWVLREDIRKLIPASLNPRTIAASCLDRFFDQVPIVHERGQPTEEKVGP
jgi:hypothetical protein